MCAGEGCFLKDREVAYSKVLQTSERHLISCLFLKESLRNIPKISRGDCFVSSIMCQKSILTFFCCCFMTLIEKYVVLEQHKNKL